MKIVVFSLGCKVNQYEGEVLLRKFFDAGFEISEKPEYADIYIINTCSVTAEADRKSRQAVSRMLKFNPKAKVYICGCSSQNSANQFLTKKNVIFVSGNASKNSLFEHVLSDINNNNSSEAKINLYNLPDKYEESGFALSSKSRIYVKIQDGCNRFCSYCIIPYLRGRSRSRNIDSIVNEIKQAATIAEEVVLTGIDVSSFGIDTGTSLTDLFIAIKDIPIRKRLSSFECNIIDRKLLDAVGEANICKHFHLSLQSGDDGVLTKMNRHYTTAKYAEKVSLIREYFPYAGITTDIISGFPSETEEQHKNTLNFAKYIKFSDIHVFPYSQRKGTIAANMRQVPIKERLRRTNELLALKKELKETFINKNLGLVNDVLIEEVIDNLGCGYTDNYIKVYVPNAEKGLLSVKLKDKFYDGIKGELS